MIQDFLKTIKGGLGDQLSGTSGLDSNQIGGVSDVITDTFKEGISEKVSSGQIGDIMGLLGKGGSSSSFAGGLANSVVGNLVSKLGLSKEISNTIATVAVPFIIDKFSSFASEKGKDNEAGITDLLGDVVTGSIKDNLLGGLGKKFGF